MNRYKEEIAQLTETLEAKCTKRPFPGFSFKLIKGDDWHYLNYLQVCLYTDRKPVNQEDFQENLNEYRKLI